MIIGVMVADGVQSSSTIGFLQSSELAMKKD